MSKKLTVSAVLASILVIVGSAAIASPRNERPASPRVLINTMTGAECFQISEAMGYTYHGR
jgi:hypothetical protein